LDELNNNQNSFETQRLKMRPVGSTVVILVDCFIPKLIKPLSHSLLPNYPIISLYFHNWLIKIHAMVEKEIFGVCI